MNRIDSYLKFLINEQTGYLNYMEDRFIISQRLSANLKKCMGRFYPTETPKMRISLYRCQIRALKIAISKFEKAKEKCQSTKMPEQCEKFYQNIIGPLENKVQFFNNEIPNLIRKANMTKY